MINVTTLGMKAEEVRRLGTQALLDGECLDGFDILDELSFLSGSREEFVSILSDIMNGRSVRDYDILKHFLTNVVKGHVEQVVLFLED